MITVRVPASSANLGPGFDTLGMAVTLHAEMGLLEPVAEVPDGAQAADESHPATIAFRRGGGDGAVWLRCPIPSGRGMGFSGAVRVAGLVAAHAQRHGDDPERLEAAMPSLLEVSSELEGHADNVAASLYGGMVATAGGYAYEKQKRKIGDYATAAAAVVTGGRRFGMMIARGHARGSDAIIETIAAPSRMCR